MEIEFVNYENQKNLNYDNYYKLEQIFNLNDEDDKLLNEEKKEFFELKPVEIIPIRRKYDFQDEFQIEEIISEKTILEYAHEIETSSICDFSFDENSFGDDGWEYFDLGSMKNEARKSSQNGEDNRTSTYDEDDEELMMMAPYQCSKCGERFQLSQSLFNHLQEFHQQDIHYTCYLCHQVFETSLSFENHMRIHADVKRPYACIDCGKKFKTFDYLENHRHNKMCNSEQNICVVCGKEFKNQFNLVRHRTVHTNERPFKCSICGKMFKQQDNLNVHVRCHKNEKPFKCEKCPKTFRDQSFLTRHQKLHISDHVFPCSVCPKRFRLEIHLEKHMRFHNSPPESIFRCPQCPKCYRSEFKLSRHMEKQHSSDVPKCRLCNKVFPNSSYLLRHMIIHRNDDQTNSSQSQSNFLPNDSPGSATVSNDVLNTSSESENHYPLRIITEKDNRPFSCPYCDRRFRTAGYMRKHQRHIHPEIVGLDGGGLVTNDDEILVEEEDQTTHANDVEMI